MAAADVVETKAPIFFEISTQKLIQ